MGEQAKVADVETVERFRAALLVAAEAFGLALEDAASELDRTVHWVESERIDVWKRRIRAAQDEVVACKSALYRKQEIKATPEARPSVVDERKALERAQRKLAFAEERLRASKRWAVELPRQAIVFKGAISPMQAMLDRDIPQLAGAMRRMTEHLAEYLRGPEGAAEMLRLLGESPSGAMVRGGSEGGPEPSGSEAPEATERRPDAVGDGPGGDP